MLTIEQPGPICRAKLQGEVTIFLAQKLFDELLPLVQKVDSLAIDLAEVTQADSSIIQLLMVIRQHLLTSGRELTLLNHSPAIIGAMETMGLMAWFGDPVLITPRRQQERAL